LTDGAKIKFYKEIYESRRDYKRELSLLFENIKPFLTTPPRTVLDYGCGQGNLTDFFRDELGSRVYKYDPAIPEYSTLPEEKMDLVTNTDVLEHIPQEEIPAVLSAIRQKSDHVFFCIHLSHAHEILSNGENAHCTVKPAFWWRRIIEEQFGRACIVPSLYDNTCCVITWKPTLLNWALWWQRQAKRKIKRILSGRSLGSILRGAKSAFTRRLSQKTEVKQLKASIERLLIRLDHLSALHDLQYRDLLDILTHKKKIAHNQTISLKSDHPVAADSLDHLHPFGTLQDNTRNFPFYKKCVKLYGPTVSYLDLGCSGGGLVFDFAINGNLAIGLEGSDLSQKMGRANWRTIPNNLFTCDITKPFQLVDRNTGQVSQFDVVGCWEVLEHIPENALPSLFANVTQHLAEGGVFIGSVSKMPEDPLHITVHDNAWWVDLFARHGFNMGIGYQHGFEFIEFCRGKGMDAFDSHNYRSDPNKGFHFVARRIKR